MVLVYVVACVVAAVMLAMVQGRPLISALSIAVMSGPFASAAAAAPLYGYYYCARVSHCVVGFHSVLTPPATRVGRDHYDVVVVGAGPADMSRPFAPLS